MERKTQRRPPVAGFPFVVAELCTHIRQTIGRVRGAGGVPVDPVRRGLAPIWHPLVPPEIEIPVSDTEVG